MILFRKSGLGVGFGCVNALSVFLQVLKVHLSAHPEVYGRAAGKVSGDKVNKNLLFDSSLEHLYITTEKKVRLTHSDVGLIDYSFLLNPFLSPSIHPTPLCHLKPKVRDSVVCLLLLFSISSIRPET